MLYAQSGSSPWPVCGAAANESELFSLRPNNSGLEG